MSLTPQNLFLLPFSIWQNNFNTPLDNVLDAILHDILFARNTKYSIGTENKLPQIQPGLLAELLNQRIQS